MISFLRKVPIIKYLVGAIIVLGVLLWWSLKRMWLAQKKLNVEVQLGAARSAHYKALNDIKRGMGEQALDRQLKAAKRATYYTNKRKQISNETKGLGGLSNAINKAFSSGS